ncbi:MAG: SufD family Fe-S cluster assembly protein [Collinsella sp.]|nr:SufD family Fe-S cluster assembly protein [Collinsella sp.]
MSQSPEQATPTVLSGVNAMPAPTWSWLKMNSATVAVPEGLAPAPAAVSVEVSEGADVLSSNADALDDALAAAGKRFASRARASAPGDAADRAAVAAGGLDAMDAPALSTYQQGAVRVEEELSVSEAFTSGMGAEAYAYLRRLGRKPTVVDVPSGAAARVTVRVAGAPGTAAVASVDVVARRGSSLELVLALDGEAPEGSAGLVGAAMRVFAASDARVSVTTVQTADDAFVALDDTGLFLDEGARVEVSHTVLGAGASYTGLAADLRGDRARIDVDTSYLGARDQVRDFNYAIRHLGRKTVSSMDANGVLAGSSKKVLRGTIDLMHGARGAEGSEQETVLLADEGVDNKTVPVILCDEDDVAGNHGATIGHVRPEQLFYLGCRGLSKEAAEALFIAAKLEDAALSAPDEAVRASVVRLGEAVVPNFKEEIA